MKALIAAAILLMACAPSSASDAPPLHVQLLIERVDVAAMKCAAGYRDNPRTAEACRAIEPAMIKVIQQGWCWGPPSVPNDHRRWMPCSNLKN